VRWGSEGAQKRWAVVKAKAAAVTNLGGGNEGGEATRQAAHTKRASTKQAAAACAATERKRAAANGQRPKRWPLQSQVAVGDEGGRYSEVRC
jgi:hypothetical protein